MPQKCKEHVLPNILIGYQKLATLPKCRILLTTKKKKEKMEIFYKVSNWIWDAVAAQLGIYTQNKIENRKRKHKINQF